MDQDAEVFIGLDVAKVRSALEVAEVGDGVKYVTWARSAPIATVSVDW